MSPISSPSKWMVSSILFSYWQDHSAQAIWKDQDHCPIQMQGTPSPTVILGVCFIDAEQCNMARRLLSKGKLFFFQGERRQDGSATCTQQAWVSSRASEQDPQRWEGAGVDCPGLGSSSTSSASQPWGAGAPSCLGTSLGTRLSEVHGVSLVAFDCMKLWVYGLEGQDSCLPRH